MLIKKSDIKLIKMIADKASANEKLIENLAIKIEDLNQLVINNVMVSPVKKTQMMIEFHRVTGRNDKELIQSHLKFVINLYHIKSIRYQ